MTARLLRPFNIDVAHNPTQELRAYFSKHKKKQLPYKNETQFT